MQKAVCPNCLETGMQLIYEIQGVPVHSVLLLRTRERAKSYPQGDIRLGYCMQCGFISNIAFKPELHEYEAQYESTQSYSPIFDTFSRQLAADLIERYAIRDKSIIEIGCGMGEFLTLLCELGDNRGVGFDPAFVSGRVKSQADIEFIKDFYSEKYAHYRADFLICKMTLEHIADPAGFVSLICSSLADSPETILFFQVPDVTRILRDVAFWDIYYEHCSYFSLASLAGLFHRYGFDILHLDRVYAGQYLVIEVRLRGERNALSPIQELEIAGIQPAVTHFQENIDSSLKAWKTSLLALRRRNQRVVLWGAGSKGVAFLTTLALDDEIAFCVDINPRKHDTFMAGSGHQIRAPEQLVKYKPDVVIVMNPIYMPEIGHDLERMGLTPKLVAVDDSPEKLAKILE